MKTQRKEQKTLRFPHGRQKEPVTDEVINKHLPFVRAVAGKVHRSLPPGIDLESLINSGVVGLLEALERYDPGRGVEFEVYARYRIHGEVMECLRSLDSVSRAGRVWGRRIEAARVRLVGKFFREPNAEEMAKELEIPLETYYRVDRELNDALPLRLEGLSIDSEAEENRLEENAHSSFGDPLALVEAKDLVEKLGAAVEALPERERTVVTLYCYKELTLRKVGEICDLSEGRICQIFYQAVAHLRALLTSPIRETG
jgi:RNA polymerase sigma factor FliA